MRCHTLVPHHTQPPRSDVGAQTARDCPTAARQLSTRPAHACLDVIDESATQTQFAKVKCPSNIFLYYYDITATTLGHMGRAWGRGEWPHSDIVSTQHPGLSRRQFAGHLATPECSCHGQPIVLLLNDHCASASRSRPSTTQCPGVSPRCPPPAAVPHSWSDAVGGVLGGEGAF